MALHLTAFSQPGDPGGGDPDVPIAGIIFLVVVGIILGLVKIYRKEKNPSGRF